MLTLTKKKLTPSTVMLAIKTICGLAKSTKYFKGVVMAEENKQDAKSALIEKVTFAILPLLFTCVVYLMSALSNLSHEVTVLNNKISLVVTSDNKQSVNTGAELARERLRQDLAAEIQKNRDDIQYNRQRIAIIETKMEKK
jgi:hypothetical protein